MAQYSIKDLEKVTGIKAHTIRIWEKRYRIVEPSRSTTNIRSYSDSDLRKLLNISLLNRNGIKISKLAHMTVPEIEERVKDLAEKPGDSDSKIESLLMAMIDLDEQRFTEELNSIIQSIGFEDCLIKIIRPFLSKAGILWMSGTISPAQEHFVSNLIRHKIISEIDQITSPKLEDPKRFLLFLPEGEMHELGILFIFYLIKKRGHESIYFGQSTPLESVKGAVEQWYPDFILLSIVNALPYKNTDQFLIKLENTFPRHKILISGYQTQFLNTEKLNRIQIIDDYDNFKVFLENI